MSVDEFLLWVEGREGKWELFDGVPVCMSPERVAHGDMKLNVADALRAAISRAGVECRFVLDSVLVRINELRGFQPDGLVYCGERHPGDLLEIPNPIIVVEVLSPSNASYDLRDKLQGYFQVLSIMHYLIIDPDKQLVIHHRRGEGDELVTRLVSEGEISFDPPKLIIDHGDLFAA